MKITMNGRSPARLREADPVVFVNQLLTVFLNSVFTDVGANSLNSKQIHSGFAHHVTAVEMWEYSDHDGSQSETGTPPQSP
ncbi:hypothetical protein [Anderseniella sp. Alg231-50]|uniref:hypothetical protein n=1 Tax=Anderseniella sp. Alg231-50 TaxID=1922226 RepID=UPI00307BBAD0